MVYWKKSPSEPAVAALPTLPVAQDGYRVPVSPCMLAWFKRVSFALFGRLTSQPMPQPFRLLCLSPNQGSAVVSVGGPAMTGNSFDGNGISSFPFGLQSCASNK